jgi:chromosome segregation ATPase
MPVLKYENDDGAIVEIVLDAAQPRVEIGRSKTCAIRTRNHSVSRHHAEVVFAGGSVTVRDLGSSNGTFAGGSRIEETAFTARSEFFCGKFRVVVDEFDQPEDKLSQEVAFSVVPAFDPKATRDLGAPLPSFDAAQSEDDGATLSEDTADPTSPELERPAELEPDVLDPPAEAPLEGSEPTAEPQLEEPPPLPSEELDLELAALRSGLKTAEAERDEARDEGEDRREALEGAEARLSRAVSEADELRERLESMDAAAEATGLDVARERDEALAEVVSLREIRDGYQVELEAGEEAQSSAKASRDDALSEAKGLRDELGDRDEAMAGLEKSLEEAQAELGTLQASREADATRQSATESELEEARVARDRLNESAEASKKAHLDGHAEAQELEAGLRAELEVTGQERDALAKSLDEHRSASSADAATLRDELTGSREKLAELQDLLETSVGPTEARELSDRLESSEVGRQEAQAALARLEADAEDGAGRVAVAEALAAEAVEVSAGSVAAREAAEAENAELKKFLVGTANSDEVAAFQARVDELERALHGAEAERDRQAAVAESVPEFEEQMAELIESRDSLAAEVAASEREATEASDGSKVMESKLARARSERSDAKRALKGAEKACAAAEKEHDGLAKALAEAEAALASSHQEAAEATKVAVDRGSLIAELEAAQAALEALTREHESVQAAHKRSVKGGAAQIKRVEVLESRCEDLEASKESMAAAFASLEVQAAELTAEAARAKALEEELAAARQEVETVHAVHSATQKELVAQLEAPPPSDEEGVEISSARAEADALRQDKERLESKLERMREALDSLEADRGHDLAEAARSLYEDVNDIASAWRNDVGLARDYFEEIEEGFTDGEQRDAAHEALRELLVSLVSASLEVKDRLKAFRGLVED